MADTDPAFGGAQPSNVVVEDDLTGINLGGYVVGNQLAAGGMGLVYEATHPEIGRRAAVKVLKPEVANDEEWSKRFLTEARAISALNHRNIVEILNFGRTPDGRQYMMMAFLEGESLEQYIARNAPIAPSAALGIIDQVLNGLAEAHKKGVVHRDMKPSNVHLLREHSGDLLVKVLDFGLARQDPVALADLAHTDRSEGASLLAGTPEYIAPEQAEGKKVGPQADLYALGVVLFEMLTGQLPFADPNVVKLLEKHLSEPPPKLSSLVSNLPEGVEELVDSLLLKDPDQRPASADIVRQTVQRLLKRLSQDATSVRAMMPAPHAPTRKVANAGELGGASTPVIVSAAARDTEIIPGRTDKALEQAFPKKSKGPWIAGAAVVAVALVLLLLLRGGQEQPVTVVPAPDVVPTEVELPAPPPVVEVAPAETAPPVAPVVDDPVPLPVVVKPMAANTPKEPLVKPDRPPPDPALSAPPIVVLSDEDRAELENCRRGFTDSYSTGQTEAYARYAETDTPRLNEAKGALSQLRGRAEGSTTIGACRKVQSDFEKWQERYTP